MKEKVTTLKAEHSALLIVGDVNAEAPCAIEIRRTKPTTRKHAEKHLAEMIEDNQLVVLTNRKLTHFQNIAGGSTSGSAIDVALATEAGRSLYHIKELQTPLDGKMGGNYHLGLKIEVHLVVGAPPPEGIPRVNLNAIPYPGKKEIKDKKGNIVQEADGWVLFEEVASDRLEAALDKVFANDTLSTGERLAEILNEMQVLITEAADAATTARQSTSLWQRHQLATAWRNVADMAAKLHHDGEGRRLPRSTFSDLEGVPEALIDIYTSNASADQTREQIETHNIRVACKIARACDATATAMLGKYNDHKQKMTIRTINEELSALREREELGFIAAAFKLIRKAQGSGPDRKKISTILKDNDEKGEELFADEFVAEFEKQMTDALKELPTSAKAISHLIDVSGSADNARTSEGRGIDLGTTMWQLDRRLRKTKRTKATDDSRQPAYPWRHVNERVRSGLLSLLKSALRTKSMPESFLTIACTNIPKPDKDLRVINGWRGVWIPHQMRQTMFGLLMPELERALENVRLNYNNGWVAHLTPTVQTRAVIGSREQQFERRRTHYGAFGDLKNFFMSISFVSSEVTEARYGVDPEVTEAHMHVYRNQTGSVEHAYGTFHGAVNSGVGQGCTLSTLKAMYPLTTIEAFIGVTVPGFLDAGPYGKTIAVPLTAQADDHASDTPSHHTLQLFLETEWLAANIHDLQHGLGKGKTEAQVTAYDKGTFHVAHDAYFSLPSNQPTGARRRITIADMYTHMGHKVGLGTSNVPKKEMLEASSAAAGRNVKALAAKTGTFAMSTSLVERRESIKLSITGGADYKGRASALGTKTGTQINTIVNGFLQREGFALPTTPLELYIAPTGAGGLGIEDATGTCYGLDVYENMRSLTGPDGAIAKSASASRMWATGLREGLMPTPIYPTMLHALRTHMSAKPVQGFMWDATIATLHDIGARVAPTDLATATAIGMPVCPFDHETCDSPLLVDCDIEIGERLGALGVKLVDDLHAGGGNVIDESTFKLIFGGGDVNFTKADKLLMRGMIRQVTESQHPYLRARWDWLTINRQGLDAERELAITMNGREGRRVHSILAAANRPAEPSTETIEGEEVTRPASTWAPPLDSRDGFN